MDIDFSRYERDEERRRTEIDFTVRFTGPIPSRAGIIDSISLVSGTDPACIVLDRLSPRAKKGEVRGRARVYDDAAARSAAER
jgi:ribosomal protein S24E